MQPTSSARAASSPGDVVGHACESVIIRLESSGVVPASELPCVLYEIEAHVSREYQVMMPVPVALVVLDDSHILGVLESEFLSCSVQALDVVGDVLGCSVDIFRHVLRIICERAPDVTVSEIAVDSALAVLAAVLLVEILLSVSSCFECRSWDLIFLLSCEFRIDLYFELVAYTTCPLLISLSI